MCEIAKLEIEEKYAMYTTKNFNDDLYQICTTHYVKFQLLKKYMNNGISRRDFIYELGDEMSKSQFEIADILSKLDNIQLKIQQNGGKLVQDPITKVTRLRKENKLQEAFNIIMPIVQADRDNEEVVVAFGWVMYAYLKESENDIQAYMNNIKLFNDNVSLNFKGNIYLSNDPITNLKNSILWSFRKVIQQDKLYANMLFPQLIRFCGSSSKFIEQRLLINKEPSASRFLIKEIRQQLNDVNYYIFMDMIGFSWFGRLDYEPSSFKNMQDEIITVPPLAEGVLNFHAKKLIAAPSTPSAEQRIYDFLEVLDAEIVKNPSYDWLSYYKAKLLIKVNRKEEALQILVLFARTKSKDFWVWDSISELVDDDEKFNCLCAALLCKTKPDMIVGIQERMIPLLVKRELFSNAKFEVDQLVSTRMQKWGKISQRIADMKNESWYSKATTSGSRENLKEYADRAEEILYQTLPYTNIFVTYVNEQKGVINFAYLDKHHIKKGYFYMDSIDEKQDWDTDQILKVKMLEDKKRADLYKIYAIAPGDETFIQHFIQTAIGYVDKEYSNPFAFVDDVYIPPHLVKKHTIQNFDEVSYIKRRTFNKKKNTWGWIVDKINSVEKDTSLNFGDEKE